MADDKGGGGGGSSWGTFEIVIGIVLLVGLLDRISARIPGIVSSGVSGSDTAVKSETLCGLSIKTPIPSQKVGRDVVVSGSAGSCDWEIVNGIALFAQVVDSKGAPLSSYTPIRTRGEDDDSFYGTVAVTSIPKTTTGYLFLVPASQNSSDETVSTRIPIKF